MRMASLGSGSSGNATLLEVGDRLVLIDCGLTLRETTRRLEALGCRLDQLAAILVTHEHADHISGVAALARKTGAKVMATRGTARKLADCSTLSLIEPDRPFYLNELAVEVRPVAVPHDAREPVQFTLASELGKAGVLTDLGCATPHVIEAFAGCDLLLIEANHDSERLAAGPYPAALKRRIASDWGHLSNDQTKVILDQIFALSGRPKHLILGHISCENNDPFLVEDTLGELVNDIQSVSYASQNEVLGWRELQTFT